MKTLILTFFFSSLFFIGFAQEGTYKGFIEMANFKRLPDKKAATVYITEVGITVKTEYSVYERYAGTYGDAEGLGLSEGQYLIELDKSAYDDDATMMVSIKEIERMDRKTFEKEKVKMITITISEFDKNETLTFYGKKIE